MGRRGIDWRMDKPRWEAKARAAFDRNIEDLKATLPPDANFRDIERAMLKFSPEMMRKTAAALANAVAGATTPDEAFSPSEERQYFGQF